MSACEGNGEVVYAVVFSNYEPSEVDSLWKLREDAESRAAELGGEYRVVEFAVRVRKAVEPHPEPPPATPLYVKPAWLVEAEAWLTSFRDAAEAARIEWVAPGLDYPSDCGDEGFVWRSDHGCLDVEMGHSMRFHGDPQQRVEAVDLPACVDLYRRWLAGRSKT